MARVTLDQIEAHLASGETYRVPFWRVDSGKPGPRVLVTAALHGNELQGSEALRQFLSLAQRGLCAGSCLLIPFANPEAVRRRLPHMDFEHDRYYGSDSVNNANCTWPGQADGSNAQRLTHALFHSVVKEATHLIDLHCWAHLTAATALARTGRPDSLALAEATHLAFGRHSDWKPEIKERPIFPCTLSSYFHDTNRPGICVELSGQYGFWPEQVRRGVQLLRNAFRHFGMLRGELKKPETPMTWLNDCEMFEVKAPATGVFIPARPDLEAWVRNGERLGHMLTTDTLKTVEVTAPCDGRIWRLGVMHDPKREQDRMFFHPHAAEGQVLASLAHPRATG